MASADPAEIVASAAVIPIAAAADRSHAATALTRLRSPFTGGPISGGREDILLRADH
jgi:hypothetical protein